MTLATPPAPPSTCFIYLRVSRDREGRELHVERQLQDCRALAARMGLTIVHVFKDNDKGASTLSKKPRPQYAEMLRRAQQGEVTHLLAYSYSRFTRRPRENETLIEVADSRTGPGVVIATVASGMYDLNTAQGRGVARTIAAWDAVEAEQTGERLRRMFEQRAETGKRHGFVPFGWRVVDGVEEVDPDTGTLLREIAATLLGGDTLRSIVTMLNTRHVPTPAMNRAERDGVPEGQVKPTDRTWHSTQVRQLMLRERNCGRATFRGEPSGMGVWHPLYDQGTHDRIVALLRDPSRRTARGNVVKHLLSGIAQCGRCETFMKVLKGSQGKPVYCCPGCYGIRRLAEHTDRVVVRWLLDELSDERNGLDLLGGDTDALSMAREEAAGIEAQLQEVAQAFAAKAVTLAQLTTITATLRPALDDAQRRARAAQPMPEHMRFIGPGAQAAWDAEDRIEVRRALIRRLLTVHIDPQGLGTKFKPESVRVTFRSDLSGEAQSAA